MRVVEPCVWVPAGIDGEAIIRRIERAGRVCYRSEDRAEPGSARSFVSSLVRRGHESVIEHEKLTVLFQCDRGVSHELVRHRLTSISQESTRYCNYSSDRFGREIAVVRPFFFLPGTPAYDHWHAACLEAERRYFALLDLGATPQEARNVLPNSLAARLVVTANMREWRHILRLRCAQAAHPQMRQLLIPLLLHLRSRIPVLFDDIPYDTCFPADCYAAVYEEAW